ncbi:MAG: hypothetical protein AAF968_18475, partial [Pseudomonadota bacterium]
PISTRCLKFTVETPPIPAHFPGGHAGFSAVCVGSKIILAPAGHGEGARGGGRESEGAQQCWMKHRAFSGRSVRVASISRPM